VGDSTKKSMVCWGIYIAFFVIYYKLLGFIWDNFVPFDINIAITNIIQVFIIMFLNIPLSVISTEKVFKIIRRNDN
jgi:hypothetical protein